MLVRRTTAAVVCAGTLAIVGCSSGSDASPVRASLIAECHRVESGASDPQCGCSADAALALGFSSVDQVRSTEGHDVSDFLPDSREAKFILANFQCLATGHS